VFITTEDTLTYSPCLLIADCIRWCRASLFVS